MEITAAIRKKDRVVTIKVTTKDVENRIKSDSPFTRNTLSNSSRSTQDSNTLSSSQQDMAQLSTSGIGSETFKRYPSKTPYQAALNLTGRAEDNWERIIADGPKHKSKTIKQASKKNKPTTKCVGCDKGSKNKPKLMIASHISYNRTVIDALEKNRYSHPNYNVEHLVPKEKNVKAKIDAKYGE